MGLKVVVGLHLYYKEDTNRVLEYFMGLKGVVGLHLYSEEDINSVTEYLNNYYGYNRGNRGIPDIKISGIRVLDLKTLEYFDFTIEECNKLEFDLVSCEDSVEEIGDIDKIVLGVPDTFSRFDSYIHFEGLFASIRSVLPIYYGGEVKYKICYTKLQQL